MKESKPQKSESPVGAGLIANERTESTAIVADQCNEGKERQDLRSRSTATEKQLRRIIAALRTGPKTTDQLRALGIYQVSARIWMLRRMGYDIITALFNGFASDGYSHARMARYTLLQGEPEGDEVLYSTPPCGPGRFSLTRLDRAEVLRVQREVEAALKLHQAPTRRAPTKGASAPHSEQKERR